MVLSTHRLERGSARETSVRVRFYQRPKRSSLTYALNRNLLFGVSTVLIGNHRLTITRIFL